MARQFRISASQKIKNDKRVVDFRLDSIHIGSVEIPGPPTLGAVVISEVDKAWHNLMCSEFDTEHVPMVLRQALDEVIEDYSKKANGARWAFVPVEFGNAQNWNLIER